MYIVELGERGGNNYYSFKFYTYEEASDFMMTLVENKYRVSIYIDESIENKYRDKEE